MEPKEKKKKSKPKARNIQSEEAKSKSLVSPENKIERDEVPEEKNPEIAALILETAQEDKFATQRGPVIIEQEEAQALEQESFDSEEDSLPPPTFINIKIERNLFIKEVKLWWSEVQGREEFEIWSSQQPFGDNNTGHHYLDVRNNSYSTRITSYPPGIYYFRVRARGQGKIGQWSKTIEASLNVGTLSIQVQKGELPASIRVSWKPIDGALAYEVCGLELNLPSQRPVRVEGTSYLYEKLSPGHYQYQVRPVFNGGKGDWEKPKDQKAIIVPEPLRSAPRYLKASVLGNKKITLSWTPVEGALVDGYRIEADLGKGRFELISPQKYKVKILPNKVDVDLMKMPPGHYSFRVCAYNFSGSGPWSNIEKLLIPGEIHTETPEELPLPIDKETLLLEIGAVYDWGFTANVIADLIQEKKLRIVKYILQELQAGDHFRNKGEYYELLRPYLDIGRDYRYALFDNQGKLLAVVSFSIERKIYQ